MPASTADGACFVNTSSPPAAAPALKHIFDTARLQHIADEARAVYPSFNRQRFLACCAPGYDELSVMGRLRRISEALHHVLPADYAQAVRVLKDVAPRLNSRFVTMILPDYVAQYGRHEVGRSMEALKFFTRFGSSEFAVRPFLLADLRGTLKLMEAWAEDDNEHVRRLASEGCRPRLPWAARLPVLLADPSPVQPILYALKADPSLYVRKSVANHLNDIAKDHPAWAMDLMAAWPGGNPHSAWIVRHALRTLVKKGDRRALGMLGAGHRAEVRLQDLMVSPGVIQLGQSVTLSFTLQSTASEAQRLVVDYAVHYVKKSGQTSAKVFKLKTVTLEAGATLAFARRQAIRDFTTRVHHAGRHEVEVLVNGESLGRGAFELER